VTGFPARIDRRLSIAAVSFLVLASLCAVLAFAGREPDSVFAHGGWRLATHGAFLFFDLLAMAAGFFLAGMRRSPAWSLVPVVAIVLIFVMLFPAFEAFQSVRG